MLLASLLLAVTGASSPDTAVPVGAQPIQSSERDALIVLGAVALAAVFSVISYVRAK